MLKIQLNELIKKERRDYSKAWRAANKDKVKRYNSNYWQRRAEKKLAEKQASEVAKGEG